ncbi:MAG TPA: VOC family protein [Blastocatellia bacterium]|nr:VOC family protein [Blastocatellia bacterium]
MGRPVVHWEISGKDGAKAQEFYSKLFDWKIDSNNPMTYGLVDTGGGGINGGIMGAPEGVPPYLTFYVQVDDLQAYLDKAESLGGKTLVPPTAIPNIGSFAMFADLDGNTVGLFKE